MTITAFDLAMRFVGIKEQAGTDKNNPFIMSFLTLDASWPANDEVPWCSAFVNYVAWLLRLPRSKSLAARSWLGVGVPVTLIQLDRGFDIVVLNRGGSPDPTVLQSPGHVGFYGGMEAGRIMVLGGNQGNTVSLVSFPTDQVLGYRRLL